MPSRLRAPTLLPAHTRTQRPRCAWTLTPHVAQESPPGQQALAFAFRCGSQPSVAPYEVVAKEWLHIRRVDTNSVGVCANGVAYPPSLPPEPSEQMLPGRMPEKSVGLDQVVAQIVEEWTLFIGRFPVHETPTGGTK